MACSRCGNGLGTCVCQSSAGPGMVWDNDSPTGRRTVLASPHVGAVEAPLNMQHHFKLSTGRVLRAGPGVVLVLMPTGDVEAVREEDLKIAPYGKAARPVAGVVEAVHGDGSVTATVQGIRPGDPIPPCACGVAGPWHNPGCSLYPEGGYPADQPWRGPPKYMCPRCNKNGVRVYGDHCTACKAETHAAFSKDLESARIRR